MAIAMAEAVVIPYQVDAGFFPWARRRDGRRDKLLIAGWAVYDVQLHSRQGCRGAMAGYPRTQAPRAPGAQACGARHYQLSG